MATNNDSVATPLPEYTAHQDRLALINALMGGTAAMQEAGAEYLPQEPAESAQAWKIRLQRTVLFNAIKRTVQKLTGEVFSKDVDVGDDVPKAIQDWLEDVDLQGRNLSRFSQDTFRSALKDKLSYILVDYPAGEIKPRRLDGILNQEDIDLAKRRPWLIHIKSDRMIGPPQYKWENGKRIMLQARFTENETVPEGYGTKEVKRIRVLTPGFYEVFEEKTDDKGATEWISLGKNPTTLTFIPLVVVEFGDEPPLEDLAYLNLAHWQSSSDQRNILHFARVPLLFGKGLTDASGRAPGEEGSNFEIGVNRLIHSTNPEADLKVVEHSGACIEAGRQDLKDLEDQMALFGLTLMLPKGVQTTATQSASDKSENDSALRGWAMILKDCLELALSYMAQWAKLGDKGGSVTVNTDFRAFSGIELDSIARLVIAGKLPVEVYVEEAQRRGAMMQSWDPVEIQAMLENEARSAGFAGLAGSILTQKAPAVTA